MRGRLEPGHQVQVLVVSPFVEGTLDKPHWLLETLPASVKHWILILNSSLALYHSMIL